jgi:hypothetical protein
MKFRHGNSALVNSNSKRAKTPMELYLPMLSATRPMCALDVVMCCAVLDNSQLLSVGPEIGENCTNFVPGETYLCQTM